jgi:JmjC domain, hydroxylase/Zinc finger, ZZ type
MASKWVKLIDMPDDTPVLCFGTDFSSQSKYDAFMTTRGNVAEIDWSNTFPEELAECDFPIYICEQRVGDLVVFPPATAHQVWNRGRLSTKLVWNILHPLSVDVGLRYVQPSYNRLCHSDIARTGLAIACAMLSLCSDNSNSVLPPDLPRLAEIFRHMVMDEIINGDSATPIECVRLPSTAIAECNFCGTSIWNRHLRCTECSDFDLCLTCYLSGRSCEHVSSFSWAEIVAPATCFRALERANEILGAQAQTPPER